MKEHYPDVIVTTSEECTACTGAYGALWAVLMSSAFADALRIISDEICQVRFLGILGDTWLVLGAYLH